jgi:hypothetical protein
MTNLTNASAAGLSWSKSSYSDGGNACVEVAQGLSAVVPVRDSKNPSGPALVIPAGTWAAFVDGIVKNRQSAS